MFRKKIMIKNQPNLAQLNLSEKQEHNNQKTKMITKLIRTTTEK